MNDISMRLLRMSRLKTWQLKYWAFLAGLPTTGGKSELQQHILASMNQPLLPPKSRRVVSVDMGIRNLAFCAIDSPSSSSLPENQTFKIIAWERMDILQTHSSPAHKEPYSNEALNSGIPNQITASHAPAPQRVPLNSDAFTPASMSRAAHTVTQTLLSHHPENILIERQRYRSGSAAAVQEWTVRVNMLEAMLWAGIETLRASTPASSPPFPETRAINPARVAYFWTTNSRIPLKPPRDLLLASDSELKDLLSAPRKAKKVEKKDKIKIVRSWIAGGGDVRLEFDAKTENAAKAFQAGTSVKAAEELAGGKLDDLADCLLQGVAFARWEENRRVIKEIWDRAVEDIT